MKTLKNLISEMDELLNKELFSLNQRKDTGEYHLFRNKKKIDTKCGYVDVNSICGRMTRMQSAKIVFSCEDEDTARTKCAKIGRDVCGTCVSHLYTDYK